MQIKNIINENDGQTCTISGIVSNSKEIPVRVDPTKMIITFDITDNTGTINTVVFPKDYKTYGKLIKNGAKLKLKGKVKQQSENPTILVASCKII